MLYDANLTALKRCVRNNEKAPDFNLGVFVNECGTYGCLVGNDAISVRTKSPLEAFCGWSLNEYNVPGFLWTFLFCEFEMRRIDGRGIEVAQGQLAIAGHDATRRRACRDREAALNRLRKTIEYIERKRAIWYEADGRISERARRVEGDWGVCASVLSSIAVSA